AIRRQLPQKFDADAGCLFWVVLEAVLPVGVFEPDLEHGVAGERQPVAARRQADHTVPGSMAAGATDNRAPPRTAAAGRRSHSRAACPPAAARPGIPPA